MRLTKRRTHPAILTLFVLAAAGCDPQSPADGRDAEASTSGTADDNDEPFEPDEESSGSSETGASESVDAEDEAASASDETPAGPDEAALSADVRATEFTQRQIPLANGFCLEANGTELTQEYCQPILAQQFIVLRDENNRLRIRTPSGYCVDVPGGSSQSGRDMQLFPCHGGPAQQFTREFLGNGFQRIRPAVNSLCLDIEYGDVAGRRLQQYGCHGGANQQFQLIAGHVEIGDGHVKCSASDQMVLHEHGHILNSLSLGGRTVYELGNSSGQVEWKCYDPGEDYFHQQSSHSFSCPSKTRVVEVKRATTYSSVWITCYD